MKVTFTRNAYHEGVGYRLGEKVEIDPKIAYTLRSCIKEKVSKPKIRASGSPNKGGNKNDTRQPDSSQDKS